MTFYSKPCWEKIAVQSQKALSAYFTSKQIMPFGFAEHYFIINNSVIRHILLINRSLFLFILYYFNNNVYWKLLYVFCLQMSLEHSLIEIIITRVFYQ